MQEDEGNEKHQLFFEKIKNGKELKHLGMSEKEINKKFTLEKSITIEKKKWSESFPKLFLTKNTKEKTSISEITLLNAAIYYGNEEAIKKLLKKGADPRVTTTVHEKSQYETVGRDVPRWETGWRLGRSSPQNLDAEQFFERFMKDKCEAGEDAEILNLIKERLNAFRVTM